MTEWKNRPIALVGLMGAGKSAVAQVLAERLGTRLASLDELIELQHGHPIPELFARLGEPAFRRLEAAALEHALGSGAGVIDCGGGIVLFESNRASLQARCRTVWLEVEAPVAARRIGSDSGRPLLGTGEVAERLASLLEDRAAWYEAAAHARIPTDGRSPADIAAAVLEALAEAPR